MPNVFSIYYKSESVNCVEVFPFSLESPQNKTKFTMLALKFIVSLVAFDKIIMLKLQSIVLCKNSETVQT